MSTIVRIFLSILCILLINGPAAGQHLVLKTKKVELLIEEWNIIHNARSVNSLSDIYDQRLVYYGERMTRKKAMSLKKQLFDSKPSFRQKIASEVEYSIHSSGTIKAEFLKETWEDAQWKPHLAYLLIEYRDGRFWVVGESDHATDKSAGYVLDIGEPLELEMLSEKIGSTDSEATQASGETATASGQNNVARHDTITLRKDYFYMLIGAILGGSALIILIVVIAGRKRNRKSRNRNYPDYPAPVYEQKPVSAFSSSETAAMKHERNSVPASTPVVQRDEESKLVERKPAVNQERGGEPNQVVETATKEETPVAAESYHGIENHLKQTSFRNYVIGLFKLSNFTYVKPKANSVLPGVFDEDDPQPILEFQGESENGRENFGVQCLYREDSGGPEITLFSEEHLNFNKQFISEIDLYYLVGVGGAPEKPTGLYLIPAKQLTTVSITRDQLRNFRKSGLFLYYKGKLR